jgi:hypothetical protein
VSDPQIVPSTLPNRYRGADPSMETPVGRNRDERQLINALERRLEYLQESLVGTPVEKQNWMVRREIVATAWVLRRVAELERLERTVDVEPDEDVEP